MLESAMRNLKLSDTCDDFEAFLTLLAKEQKEGRNYVTLLSIPTALHYKLVQADFVIKREERTVRKFGLFKKTTYYYSVKPGK